MRYAVTRYLYRPISVPLASALARTSIHPTHVTWVSAAISIAGGVAFARGEYVLGGILALLGIITDCVDGDLARLTGRSSRAGAFLDSVLDRWTDAALILGVVFSDIDRFTVVGSIALVASLLTSYTRARAQSLGIDSPEGIGGRDTRTLVIGMAGITGGLYPGLVVVAVLGGLTSLQRAIVAGRELVRIEALSNQEVRAIDAQSSLDKALRLAHEAHAGQKDKAGRPYVEHLERVSSAFDDPWEKTVAILHDVLEDTDLVAQDLRAQGFPDHVVEAVDAMTKRADEEYLDFVRRSVQNSLARRVKRADLLDNVAQTRASDLSDEERSRLIGRYEAALEIVEEDGVADTA